MIQDGFGPFIALDPQTNAALPGGVVEFFAIDDTTFTTPIAIFDEQGVPIGTTLEAGPNGAFVGFTAPGYTQLVPRTVDGVVTPAIYSRLGLVLQPTGPVPDPTGQDADLAVATDGVGGYTLVPLPDGGGGGGGGWARADVSILTSSLAADAQETGVVELGDVYSLLQVEVSGPARVRLYDTEDHRDDDMARERGTDPDPTADHGIILDFAIDAAGTRTLSPMPTGATFDGTVDVPFTIDNLDVSAATITVTITYLRTE